jgi:hypothetical protein
MKKFTLILVGLFLFATSFAKKGEGWIGLKGGFNYATALSNYTDFTPKPLQAYNGGIVLGGLMGKSNIMFEMSFLYSVKGWNEEESQQGITAKRKTELNYIEWPVNFGYRFNLGDNFHLAPYVGFYSAYGLSGKETGTLGVGGNAISTTRDLTFGYQNGELFAWDIGANWGINFEYKNIQLSARYAQGIMGLENKSALSNGWERNSVISLSLAYLIRINKSK